MNVSNEIKEAFNPNSGEGGRFIDYSVRFEIINEDSQNNTAITASEDTEISLKNSILTNDDVNDFITFEKNGFRLNGSQVVPPTPSQNIGNIGYLSNSLSDNNAKINLSVTLTSQYSANLIATTINFGYVYAVDFNLKYYNENNALIHEKDVINNEEMLFLYNYGILNVKKIVITVSKISRSSSRVRIGYFLFGAIKIYDKTNSDTMEITEIIDPINERVPTNTLKLVTENFSNEFNIFDPTGIYEYFSERQLLKPKIGAMYESSLKYISMGNYYLLKPKLSGNTSKINISATDILGVLSDTIYQKGILKTASLRAFLNDVFYEFNLPFLCPDRFSDITVETYIKTQSHSDILRKIAQASNTFLYVSKSGVITFEELSNINTSHSFTGDDYNLNSGISPSEETIINTIEIETANFTVSSASEKLIEISGSGTFNVSYEPSVEHSAAVSGGTVSNITYYADNAVFTLSGGTIIISGRKIINNRNTINISSKRENEKNYISSIKDNEFISNKNAATVAEYILSLKAKHRRLVKMNYRGYPYLDVGEKAYFHINDSFTQEFFITKNELKCAGGMTGTLETREYGF